MNFFEDPFMYMNLIFFPQQTRRFNSTFHKLYLRGGKRGRVREGAPIPWFVLPRGMAGTRLFEPLPLPPTVCLSSKLGLGAVAGIQATHFNTGPAVSTVGSNARSNFAQTL